MCARLSFCAQGVLFHPELSTPVDKGLESRLREEKAAETDAEKWPRLLKSNILYTGSGDMVVTLLKLGFMSVNKFCHGDRIIILLTNMTNMTNIQSSGSC